MFTRKPLPTIPTLELYCNAFHITLNEFFTVNDIPILLTPEQKELLLAFDCLGSKEKELAYTYILGLSRNPHDSTMDG